MPARCRRIQSSAKILSMKRSSRVSFVSQRRTSSSEHALLESMVCGKSIPCSCAVTWIDAKGYVVSPLDGVNEFRTFLEHLGLLGSCHGTDDARLCGADLAQGHL